MTATTPLTLSESSRIGEQDQSTGTSPPERATKLSS